jgi:hypothetical protein
MNLSRSIRSTKAAQLQDRPSNPRQNLSLISRNLILRELNSKGCAPNKRLVENDKNPPHGAGAFTKARVLWAGAYTAKPTTASSPPARAHGSRTRSYRDYALGKRIERSGLPCLTLVSVLEF